MASSINSDVSVVESNADEQSHLLGKELLKKAKTSFLDAFLASLGLMNVSLVDHMGQTVGEAKYVSVYPGTEVNVALHLFTMLKKLSEDSNPVIDACLDDMIYMALRETGNSVNDLSPEKRLHIFLQDLEKEPLKLSIYHLRIVSCLLGARQLVVFKGAFNFKSDCPFFLGPIIRLSK
jgi:hypothetical protein